MPTATSNEPPFGRGVYQPFATGVAAAEQAFYGVLGQEWEFDDVLWDTGGNGPPTIRSSAKVRVRLVKNNTGSAILPKKACKIDPANAGSVTALCSATNDEAYPADEFLPAAGVPDKGVFWVVTRGLGEGGAAGGRPAREHHRRRLPQPGRGDRGVGRHRQHVHRQQGAVREHHLGPVQGDRRRHRVGRRRDDDHRGDVRDPPLTARSDRSLATPNARSNPWTSTTRSPGGRCRTSSGSRSGTRRRTTGPVRPGLAFGDSGLIISTICDNEATPTVYTSAGSTTETIATLGTFAAPTATKCRFKKVDDTNNPGLVEIQIADARFAVAGARRMTITISGVSDAEQTDVQIDLTGQNNPVNGNAGDVVNRTTIAVLSTQVSFTLTGGSADNDAYNGCVVVVRDQTTAGPDRHRVHLRLRRVDQDGDPGGGPGHLHHGERGFVTILPPSVTQAALMASLNGATLAVNGSTFVGTMTIGDT
jgi:hypothetical protein